MIDAEYGTTFVVTVSEAGRVREWRVIAPNAAAAALMLSSTARVETEILDVKEIRR